MIDNDRPRDLSGGTKMTTMQKETIGEEAIQGRHAMETPRSLAAFKRILATPGATLTLVRYELAAGGETVTWRDGAHKYMGTPRTVVKMQSATCQLQYGSWLSFGKASDWSYQRMPTTGGEFELHATQEWIDGNNFGVRLTYTVEVL